MSGDGRVDPITAFKAHGQSVCIRSEKFGVEVWIVPAVTGKDRLEFTAEDMHHLGNAVDVLGGTIERLVLRDGRVLEAVPGWKERVEGLRRTEREVEGEMAAEARAGVTPSPDLASARDLLRKERVLSAIGDYHRGTR